MTDRSSTRALPWIVAVGVVARGIPLLAGRSLWLDEAMLALNITGRSFGGLAGPLDFNQAAPLGFLWLERLAVVLLGPTELALRAWPFVAGVAALVAFAALARRVADPPAALFAVTAFALSASLVYYSAEVKQYAFDVLLAVLLPLLAARREPRWALVGVAGAVGVWLSHPLVFVLPGVAAALWLSHRGERAVGVVALAWTASFAAAFLTTGSETAANPLMARFWTEGFMPVPPTGAEELRWYGDAVAGWLRNALDFSETVSRTRTAGVWAGALLAAAGVVRGWRAHRARLPLVLGPPALAVLASALRAYPFQGRLILFLVPSTILLLAWGVEWAAAAGPPAVRTAAGGAAGAYLVAAAIILTGWVRAPYREELRPVLAHVGEAARPGDVVYLHSGAQHAALFYERTCPSCRIEHADVVRGGFLAGEADAIRRELEALPRGGRVWLLFSHEWWGYGDLERDAMVADLAVRGRLVERFDRPGAEAFLYELGP